MMVVTLGQQYNIGEKPTVILCVCVCVFFPFILDIKFVGRTSRGHTGQEEGHTGFLIHLLIAVHLH